MTLDFYYYPSSPPSCIVWMVLKELEIPYKGHVVDIMAGKHKEDDYKKINPRSQVPAIKDGELMLSESRAIATYLCGKYERADKKEKLFPAEPMALPKFMELLFRDIDNYHSIMRYLNGEAIFAGQAKGPNEALLPKATQVLDEYEELLGKHHYIFGDHLTLLDLFAAHTIGAMQMSPTFDKWGVYKNLAAWKGRMAKLPYFQECIKEATDKNKKMYQEFLKMGPAMFKDMQKK